MATRPGQSNVKFDFDQKSGLLTRETRYADTPLGRNATQIDFSDYRDVDGIKVPFRWTLSRPVARFTIQIKETKLNVPIDDAKFRPNPPQRSNEAMKLNVPTTPPKSINVHTRSDA